MRIHPILLLGTLVLVGGAGTWIGAQFLADPAPSFQVGDVVTEYHVRGDRTQHGRWTVAAVGEKAVLLEGEFRSVWLDPRMVDRWEVETPQQAERAGARDFDLLMQEGERAEERERLENERQRAAASQAAAEVERQREQLRYMQEWEEKSAAWSKFYGVSAKLMSREYAITIDNFTAERKRRGLAPADFTYNEFCDEYSTLSEAVLSNFRPPSGASLKEQAEHYRRLAKDEPAIREVVRRHVAELKASTAPQ